LKLTLSCPFSPTIEVIAGAVGAVAAARISKALCTREAGAKLPVAPWLALRIQVPVPSLVTVTTVFGLWKEVETVQIPVVLEVIEIAPPAVEVTFRSNVPVAPI
jgi:hypothetical protein